MDSFIQWELQLLHAIQEAATEGGSVFWSLITYFGESGVFWIVLSLILLFFPKTRLCGMTMAFSLLFGLILGNGVLKNVIARPRPYHLDPQLQIRLVWGEMTKDFSCPSGHTLASFEAATAILLCHKKWGVAAMALAVCIGVSRIFLLVHYPSDVLFGAVLGILIAIGSFALAKVCHRRLKERFPKF